jgi:putative ABC transport system permease protein
MFYTFFKILVRDIKKDKISFLIKTFGLTVGLTCFFLILLFVLYEFSYDKQYPGYKNIYRIVMKQPENMYQGSDMFDVTPGPLVPHLKENFPEIRYATRIQKTGHLVQYKNNSTIENRIYYVDVDFLKIFPFQFISGNPDNALDKPNSVVLTKKTAHRYFGDINPVGQSLLVDENKTYEITGIIEDIPDNSHLKFDFLVSFSTYYNEHTKYFNWISNSYRTYVQLSNNMSVRELEDKVNLSVKDKFQKNSTVQFILQPLADIHLHGNCNFEMEKNGSFNQIVSFFVVGLLILIIACFNYINISTANMSYRLKEAGVRKVIGATNRQLFIQFIGESFIYVFVASLLVLIVIYLMIPKFNAYLQREIPYLFLFRPKVLLSIALSAIVISILSGIFPSLIITKYKPDQIFKNIIQTTRNKFISLQNSFVIAQFVISIILIIATITAYQQLRYLQNKDLGFQKENVINIILRDRKCRAKYMTMKNELLRNSNIIDVTVSSSLLGNVMSNTNIYLEGKSTTGSDLIYRLFVDENFLEFYGIPLNEGNSFTKLKGTNSRYHILNQTAVDFYNLKEPVGQTLRLAERDIYTNGQTIGVIKDIYFFSLHNEICPLAISNLNPSEYEGRGTYLSIKISPQDIEETISYVKKVYTQFSPNYPFSYSFLNSTIENIYANESRYQNLSQLFSFIAIFIACLGLFSLADLNLEKRTKEIGIRKVSGAKISEVMIMLNMDFVKWIAIAFIIGCPIAWYFMHKWLENFAYKTGLSWWIFVLAGLLGLTISLITVSWQSWKAATRNPVEALRYE